jgi:hypothetical protein
VVNVKLIIVQVAKKHRAKAVTSAIRVTINKIKPAFHVEIASIQNHALLAKMKMYAKLVQKDTL